MNVLEFQRIWGNPPAHLTERAAAQSHFNDLCELFGQPKPTDDPEADYTFERGVRKLGGGQGFADVWKRGSFAWEYKRPGGDLAAAYVQLRGYVDDLANPPLLICCDLVRFEVHTNFTGQPPEVHRFTVHDLSEPATLDTLRRTFTEPWSFRTASQMEEVTKDAAARFGSLATAMHARNVEPLRAAHFLVQILFCFFAEDVGLLPRGLFGRLLRLGADRPAVFAHQAAALFAAMRDGGVFGVDVIDRFNGGLFAESDPVELTAAELAELAKAAELDWGKVEPAIFGTLFERALDPNQRAALGAHYTGRSDIERVVEPVVLAPLRRDWDALRPSLETMVEARDKAQTTQTRRNREAELRAALGTFQQRLADVRVLDPACGSGNFLYIALAGLLDLERRVLAWAAARGIGGMLPAVHPSQMLGLEINRYARELAQAAVWIGYLQWMIAAGFTGRRDPILEPLETIRLQDALLDLSDPAHPKEAEWPEADFIIGNPPFLGDKKLRPELGDAYVDSLFSVFQGSIPGMSDLCCYFFELARRAVEVGSTKRVGLLATNSIRQGANRRVLERIKATGDIFQAWSNEPWVLNGASVRISIVAFDNGAEGDKSLNGVHVDSINADLTSSIDATTAVPLSENRDIAFVGVQPTGAFDVSERTAMEWLAQPLNPNGRPNSDVVRPYFNGSDLTGRWSHRWIIDFGPQCSEQEAALYQVPFEHLRAHVKPTRAIRRERRLREQWWLHERSRGEMRTALHDLDRFLATSMVSTHRFYGWLDKHVLPANLLVVFARQDDYFCGVLHSRAHEVWALYQGSDLGVGDDPRYNVGRCFETFALPWSPGAEPWRDERLHSIANAARALVEARVAWLNPEGATEAELKKRTLTNLYNARPTWLANLHAALDRAVWAAYGWDDDPCETTDEQILERLLALNQQRVDGIPSQPAYP